MISFIFILFKNNLSQFIFIIKMCGYFTKLGGALKEFISDPGEYIKQGAIKYAPAIQEATGVLKNIPGPIGLISTGLHSGIKAARESLQKVPNENVKSQLENELYKSSNGQDVTVTPKGEIIKPSDPNTNKDFLAKQALSFADSYLGPTAGGMIRTIYKYHKRRKKRKK
jgi:hypothetical protein